MNESNSLQTKQTRSTSDLQNSRNPFVFVAGCPRSGTTLMQRMLDNHPQLAVANDTHFIPRAAGRALQEKTDPALTEKLVEKTYSYHRFYRLGLSKEAVLAASEGCSTYGQFVSRLYDAFAGMHTKPLAGEKTPDYGRYIAELLGMFPWAKIIHLVRDGRDVALSTIHWAVRRRRKGPAKWGLWNSDPIAACAFWWLWQVTPALQAEARFGPQKVLRLPYESLVTDPAAQLRRITDFLALPYTPSMAAFHVGKEKNNGTGSAKSQWKPATQGLRDWRRDMDLADVLVFNAIAGKLLGRLGYETSPEADGLADRERISRAWEWWQASPYEKRLSLHAAIP